MEFKELTLEELTRGYVWSEEEQLYQCIFCGDKFEEGLIYSSRGKSVNALRAMQEHIFDEHGSVFECLLDLDKQMNGLSDAQKDVLEGLYYEKDNKAIGEEMGISDATVRTYKFNLQKLKRRARIFLAMMEQIENEEIIALRKRLEPEQNVENIRKPHFDTQFGANLLHPFFTQYNFK
ncbi:LuxR C-terminal-related transcriptional regulator [Eubacterium ramulus]|uniref:LuxR C-terminal-related transcriptional regulator n=1 Tax=Eubacterium ramulus TaxID=39490 RepID=UPI00241EA634|nr:LuxR C-terminal-related transcriptional regulator [Eubacterium ramulus]